MKSKISFLTLFLYTHVFSQIENTKDSIVYSQRNFQENFQEKYTGNEFNYEPVMNNTELSAWDRFWKSFWQFISELFNFGGVGNSLTGLQILLRIIAILVIIFVVYLIVKIIINKEGGWIFSKSSNNIKVAENIEENIHSIDFHKIIDTEIKNKNYRTAIRYYYLWLLKSFSDKKIIEWDIEKTNNDYYNEISSSDVKQTFRYLSYIFEYSWYGEFDLTKDEFEKAERVFKNNIK